MKAVDIEKIAMRYPTVDRKKISEALAILEKVSQAGALLGSGRQGATLGRSGLISPDPKHDPRTIKLRTRP